MPVRCRKIQRMKAVFTRFQGVLRVYFPQRRRARLGADQVRCVFRKDSGSLSVELPPSSSARWRAVARVLRSSLDALGCVLLPTSCALCGTPLPRLDAAPICALCWAEIVREEKCLCGRCGDLLDQPSPDASAALCRACRLAPPPFRRAVAYGPYEGRMRDAIHALKYGSLRPAARELGARLAVAIAQLAGEAPFEMLVVPVPLHRSKQTLRGFNQARLLASTAIAALHGRDRRWRLKLASRTLMRLRATESQAGLTPHQRRANLRGAFSVADAAVVKEKDILLIDDILTTGATARAAAMALRKAGAASVWVAALARAHRLSDVSDRGLRAGTSGPQAIRWIEPGQIVRRDSLQDHPSF